MCELECHRRVSDGDFSQSGLVCGTELSQHRTKVQEKTNELKQQTSVRLMSFLELSETTTGLSFKYLPPGSGDVILLHLSPD